MEQRADPPSVGMLLVRLGQIVSRTYNAALEPRDLRCRHLAALAELEVEASTQQALSARLGADPSKLVTVLDDLEAAGLASRCRDPEDRRRHIVRISDRGRGLLHDADDLVARLEDMLFSNLTHAEREMLHELLVRALEPHQDTACAPSHAALDDLADE